jgi:hypothetical protein
MMSFEFSYYVQWKLCYALSLRWTSIDSVSVIFTLNFLHSGLSSCCGQAHCFPGSPYIGIWLLVPFSCL